MEKPKVPCTAEEAARWYREQPGNEEAVRAGYFDLPVRGAAERYAQSEEFAEVQRLLGQAHGRAVLDLGAGNGIASFALAQAGWNVTAFEPDQSAEIGAEAIRALARETGAAIAVEDRLETPLPFATGSFDVIFARQVMHHVPSLAEAYHELFRILRPGGVMLALREHVVSNATELEAFLQAHPTHHLYLQENAHPIETYLGEARRAGFQVRAVWGMVESILNFYPQTEAQRQKTVRGLARRRFFGLGRYFMGHPAFLAATARRHAAADRNPGRLYSFLLAKP